MPNLDFYALGEDHRQVLEFVYGCGEFRVFELNSAPDQEIVEFHNLAPLLQGSSLWLQLLPIRGRGSPYMRRTALHPGALGMATFRYSCEGWGLIQLYLQTPQANRLRPSHTNHNSQTRAKTWSPICPELGDPDLWDWREVGRASRKLNRYIQSQAVSKCGSRPVLKDAAQSQIEFLLK